MDRLAGVLLIGILIAAWMFRWEVIPSAGTENTAVLHFKIDRLTGTSYTCGRGWCEES